MHLNTGTIRWAGLAVAGLVFAAPACADQIRDAAPPVGQVQEYTMTGGGNGALVMPGSDQTLPLDVETSVALKRKVTDIKTDGVVTTQQEVTRDTATINGQEIGLGKLPAVTITTDSTGKVTAVVLAGKTVGETAQPVVGPSSLQTLLAMWQLPHASYQSGQTWTDKIPLSLGGAAEKNAPIGSLVQTYTGMKPLDGKPMMTVLSHLSAPVTVTPRTIREAGGFSIASVKIDSFDQTSFFDPVSGSLVSADANLNLEVGAEMGHGPQALPMTVRMPITIQTRRVREEAAASEQAKDNPGKDGDPAARGPGDTHATNPTIAGPTTQPPGAP